ncbi:DUF3261 domain-containing protein [Delftia acidovorans]|uniref:DUF3261 domain-containing protein n=1 Tax=Delftia acidovorans TaxID=80866 RepID=UPI001EFC657F|nr:DUF3261 domain-containing protein [Delftia acidovorans]MCG8985548.1 DUF3261 domain-containing protein [Delftia acidovorans]
MRRLRDFPAFARRRAPALFAACAAIITASTLAGCSTAPEARAPQGDATPPRLALPPAALGCELALQQRLVVQAPGQPAQELDALLEVDAQTVRLALVHLGQRVGVIVWDGQQLQAELSRWWPAQLAPAQVLGDMQLALWPVDAIARDLPASWMLQEVGTPSGSARRLSHQGQTRVEIRPAGSDGFEIVYAAGAWQLRVASPGGMRPCANAGEGA